MFAIKRLYPPGFMNNIAYCVETFVFFMITYRVGLGMTGGSHNAGKKRCDCVYGPPKKIDPAANPEKEFQLFHDL